MLTEAQIDRYSRQIILPEVGGRGQERLQTARLALCAEWTDLLLVLDYLAGAGIGEILIDTLAQSNAPSWKAWLDRVRGLNPEVRIELGSATGLQPRDATLVLAGSQRVLDRSRAANAASRGAVIFARLDAPLLAVLPKRPPCLACADARLLAPFSPRNRDAAEAPTAAIVAMAAAGETIKQLLGIAPPGTILTEFHGYEMVPFSPPSGALHGCQVCG